MIPFKRINEDELEVIKRFVAKCPPNELSERVLPLWLNRAIERETFYTISEGRLMMRYRDGHYHVYCLPFGTGNMRYAMMSMLEATSALYLGCVIADIPESMVKEVHVAMPKHFEIEQQPDSDLYRATANKEFNNSVFFNNEGMIPGC